MELRVLAFLSGDENLAESFRSGIDLHTVNASKMFKVTPDKVTKKMRQVAKIIGFSCVYGAKPSTIAAQTKSTIFEGEEFQNSWYRAYPKTREFQKREWGAAKSYGHTYSPFGRIRWLDDLATSKEGDSHAWRQAINSNIQSTASDLVLIAIMEIYDEIERLNLQSKLFGFIHDAAISDVYPGELWEILKIKKRMMEDHLMQSYPWITVPLVASFDICPGWGFPCEVTRFNDSEIELVGPSPHVALLQREVAHLPGVRFEETGRKVDDKGVEEITAILRR
jgi:DNA polymerase-1